MRTDVQLSTFGTAAKHMKAVNGIHVQNSRLVHSLLLHRVLSPFHTGTALHKCLIQVSAVGAHKATGKALPGAS